MYEAKRGSNKELQEAVAPLIDYLYKYGCPHDYVLGSQTSAEILSGEVFVNIEPRD